MEFEEVKILPVLGGTGTFPAWGTRHTQFRGSSPVPLVPTLLGSASWGQKQNGAPSSCTSTSRPWRALWGHCQAQTWENTHPLPTNHKASSQLLTQPSVERQRNKQIPNHQRGSQRGNQYKPSGKCTNGHENVCRLSPISKPHLEK